MKNRRELGNTGEDKAVKFLQDNDYQIMEKNFRAGRLGEIDIIARNKSYLCFIEVKTRQSLEFGTPAQSVTKRKQQKIIRLASIYLARNRLFNSNIRFDVIEVFIKNKEEYEINIIENAFCQDVN